MNTSPQQTDDRLARLEEAQARLEAIAEAARPPLDSELTRNERRIEICDRLAELLDEAGLLFYELGRIDVESWSALQGSQFRSMNTNKRSARRAAALVAHIRELDRWFESAKVPGLEGFHSLADAYLGELERYLNLLEAAQEAA